MTENQLKAMPVRVSAIEDAPEFAAYISKALGELGVNMDHSGDGRDGLLMASTENYDVMVIDRMLPGLGGLSILRTVRANDN